MKVLIWLLCIIVATFLNVLLGYATGFRLGYILLYLAIYFVAGKLCDKWDECEEKKRQIANEGYYQYRASLWVCKKCGASNPPDRDSCQRCGTVQETKVQETEGISLESYTKKSEEPDTSFSEIESQDVETDALQDKDVLQELKGHVSSMETEDGIEIIKPKVIIRNSDQ